ncbi:MAG: [Fe-Fe] hydrogenase large subunit C-terminal domain-containing protein [Spirochaetaceae bacterium]
MSEAGFVTVDNIEVPIEGEKNLLSLIRKANIEVPTFCYHSHLSTYGACRLCLVEIDGKKTDASCVVPPKAGMKVKTTTPRIRAMRRMNLELLLANHTQDCPTCTRSESCKLRDLASKMGVKEVRFPRTKPRRPLDEGSVALDRDPNKCILCGDCVRYCSEVQGIGAVDFAHRGEDVVVTPAFGRSLGEVDCVNCGQCAAVCPTAAIIPKSHVDRVWADVQAEKTYVVAQVAPAVRVALGEMFGMKPGETVTGKITTALRMLGFDAVYDTSFGADLTVMEEAAEFLQRREAGERLPMFTSCCPAWVKFAEQSFPELLPHLSSCMSPQSMVGSLVKRTAPVERGLNPEQVKVVSIMPCTAKKYEVQRPELSRDGQPYVDHVLTTAELGRMIQEAGIRFADLPAASMDLPMGFSSGAGVIFGNSGGVAEAVARYLGDGEQLNVAVVQGIAEAKRLAREVREGRSDYDLVEVMACPGGCIGGAGQPVSFERDTRSRRAAGIRENDAALALRRSSDNPFVGRYYEGVLGGRPGSHEAHELLHTAYRSRKRIEDARIPLISGTGERRVSVRVCVGTSCFLRGSQDLLTRFIHRVSDEGLDDLVDVNATFCSEQCNLGPTVHIDDEVIHGATVDAVTDRVKELTATPVAG